MDKMLAVGFAPPNADWSKLLFYAEDIVYLGSNTHTGKLCFYTETAGHKPMLFLPDLNETWFKKQHNAFHLWSNLEHKHANFRILLQVHINSWPNCFYLFSLYKSKSLK